MKKHASSFYQVSFWILLCLVSEKVARKKKQICRKFVLVLIRIVSDFRIQNFPVAELNTALWFSVCSPSLSLWFLEEEAEHLLRSRLYCQGFIISLFFFPSLILSFLGNQTKGEILVFFFFLFNFVEPSQKYNLVEPFLLYAAHLRQ